MVINLQDGELVYIKDYYSEDHSNQLFLELRDTLEWKQDKIKMFGKVHNVPRLQAWYGDEGKSYSYSGIKMIPTKWTDTLLAIKNELEKTSGASLNSVLANLYRNGNDSNGWHADDEKELGTNPVIVSLSLGESRKFKMKHKIDKKHKFDLELTHGSLLIMKGSTQHYWKHTISKTAQRKGERINLTYRYIM
jgi:alkylated DNA repair dioxygenase AlkB